MNWLNINEAQPAEHALVNIQDNDTKFQPFTVLNETRS